MANPFVNLLGQMSMLGKPQQAPMFNMPRVNNAPQQSMPELQMYEPQYSMQNRFAGLLDNMPQPNNPNVWQRIGASLSGLGKDDSYGAAQQVAYAPYFNELNQFKMRAPLMQQAADNERQMNQVGMNANNQNRQFMINEQKNDIAQQKADDARAIADTKNEIARIRANAYDFKSRNPNLDIQAPPGGFLIGINPQTGQAMPILDDQGQKIPSGKLSDEDRIILTGKQQQIVAGINQAGANQRNEATIASANERNAANIANRTQMNDADNAAAMQRVQARPQSTNIKTQRASRAQDIINRNPDLADVIGKDGTVAPAIAPSRFFNTPSKFDENFRQQVVDYIEGKTTAVPVRTKGTVTPIRNTPGMPPIPNGATVQSRVSGTGPQQITQVPMITPDGREVMIPSDKVDEAVKRGARRK